MKKVMADMSAEKLQRHGIPAARELSTGDWFTSRVSATALFGPLLAKIKDAEASAELRSLFGRLCRDDTPMVRRAAAGRLDEVAGAIDHTALVSELLPHFNSLIADDHDSTRLIAVGQCANVAKLLTEAECNTHMLELVKACAEDKSWRVRVNIAKDFFTVRAALAVRLDKRLLTAWLVVGCCNSHSSPKRLARQRPPPSCWSCTSCFCKTPRRRLGPRHVARCLATSTSWGRPSSSRTWSRACATCLWTWRSTCA